MIFLGGSGLWCLNTFNSLCRHKADYLKSLITDQDIVVHAAYGSNKDIAVYSSLSIKSEQILIFGKPSKKQSQLQVTWLTDGYAEHLANLTTPGTYWPWYVYLYHICIAL